MFNLIYIFYYFILNQIEKKNMFNINDIKLVKLKIEKII